MFSLMSLVVSVCTLVLELVLSMCDSEASIHSYIGDSEIYILMGISVVLLIIGLVRDVKRDKELYG